MQPLHIRPLRDISIVLALVCAPLVFSPSAGADDGGAYRAPVGPPAPEILSDDQKNERKKVKKMAVRAKAKAEFLGRPWALELLPHDLNRLVYDAVEASGGTANYNYLYGDYRADVSDREPGWAEKNKVLRKGPFAARLIDDPSPGITLRNPNDLGPVSRNRLASQIDKRTIGSLRRQEFEAARKYGGRNNAYYLYGNDGLPIPGLGAKEGLGPFNRCLNNDRFERDREFC